VSRFQCYHRGDGQIRWRLLGGNNRPLGVGCATREDVRAVVADITALRTSLTPESFRVARTNGRWQWTMQIGTSIVAQSAQSFARRVDAEMSELRFRHQAPTADIDERVAVFLPRKRLPMPGP
jgi:hypothetical protein